MFRYVVPYTGKTHNTSQAKIDAFQKYQHEVSEHMTWYLIFEWYVQLDSYQWTYSLIFEWYVSLDLLPYLLYINQTEHCNQLTLDQFLYQVLIQSTFNKKNKDNSNDDNDDNHVQDVLANQHQL